MLLIKIDNYFRRLRETEKLFYGSFIFLCFFYYVPNNKLLVFLTFVFLLAMRGILKNLNLAVLYVCIFLIPFQNGKGIDFLVVPPQYIQGNIPFVMTPTLSMTGLMILIMIYLHIRKIIYGENTQNKSAFSFSDASILVFFVTSIVASVQSDIPLLSLLLSIQIWGYIYAYYNIRILQLKTTVRNFLFPIFSSLTIYEGVWSILQFMNKGTLGSWAENTLDASITGTLAHAASEDRSLFRMQGTFSHPNFLGFFMAMTAPVLLYYSISRYTTKFEKTVGALGFAFGSIGLALSSSRASWICYIIGIILVFTPTIIRASIQLIPTIKRFYTLLVLICLLVVPFLVIPRLSQLVITFDPSGGAVFRWNLIIFAFQIVSQYPLGVGFGIFPKILLEDIGGFTSFPTQPHNLFAQIIVACGYIGIVSFIWFIYLQIKRGLPIHIFYTKDSHSIYMYKISTIIMLVLSMFYPILTEQQLFAWFWILLSAVV